MAKRAEVIVFHSPAHQTGSTVTANFVGLNLAEAGKLVLLIDLDRFCSLTNIIHKRISIAQESLKAVIERPNIFSKHIVKSSHNSNFYYLAQPPQSGFGDMLRYSTEMIDNIVELVSDVFDYVILDVPAGIEEISAIRVFNKSFRVKVDKVMLSLTEDLRVLKMLAELDTIYGLKTSTRYNTDIIINRSRYLYNDYMENCFKSLNTFDVRNVFNIINLPILTEVINSGSIYALGESERANEFLLNMTQISQSILTKVEGIGIKLEDKKSKKQSRLAKVDSKSKAEIEASLSEKKIEEKLFGTKKDENTKNNKKDKKNKTKTKDKTKDKTKPNKGLFGRKKKAQTEEPQDQVLPEELQQPEQEKEIEIEEIDLDI